MFKVKKEYSIRCLLVQKYSIISVALVTLFGLWYTFALMGSKIFACDFEVFGVVQGVFFRKYTEKQAKSLNIRGWCMNTHGGTVKGQLEGPEKEINKMKVWLETKGSPSSQITKAVFSPNKEINEYTFSDFTIKR